MNSEKKLTSDDVALYDRQIRVWGFDAQQRLQNARILILGMNGLQTEVIKNLVLVGVDQLEIFDVEEKKNHSNLSSEFFLRQDDLSSSSSLSDTLLARIQELNPRVKVSKTSIQVSHAFSQHVDTQSYQKAIHVFDEYLKKHQFDVFICSQHHYATPLLSQLNQTCRHHQCAFIAGNCFGLYGWFFLDCDQRVFFTEEKQRTLQVTPSLDEIMAKKWSDRRIFRKMDKLYYAIQVYLAYHQTSSSSSCSSSSIKDFATHYAKKQEALDDDWFTLVDAVFHSMHAEIAPVTAILGGLIAQQAQKIISGNERVESNLFFYSGEKGSGSFYSLQADSSSSSSSSSSEMSDDDSEEDVTSTLLTTETPHARTSKIRNKDLHEALVDSSAPTATPPPSPTKRSTNNDQIDLSKALITPDSKVTLKKKDQRKKRQRDNK